MKYMENKFNMDFSTVKDLIINNQPVIKLQVGNIIIWEKKSSINWILDESGYIIGDDGKCYQRFYDDSNMIDNNPVPDLNAQWVEDTVSGSLNIDSNYDYFMSNSNYNVHNSYAQFKVSWNNLEEVNFLYRSYAESNYDYLVINGLDKPKFTSKPSYSTSGILAHTRGSQTTTYKTINVKTPDKGEHSIWFCYIKDGSGNSYSDRAFVGIPNNYKIGELLEKQGEELEYEYLISGDIVLSENDGYIRYKYYKTYFTPNRLNTIKTEDYILGEEVAATPISRNYLRFDATKGDLHIGVNALDLFNNLEYSKGFEESWTTFTTDGIDVPNGSSVYFRAQGMSATDTERGFTTNIGYECHGNIMSLLGDNFENNTTINNPYSFYGLFKNTAILTAPELPAVNIKNYCYENMFYGCNRLVDVPDKLPATTLAYGCYQSMFRGCTSLVTAPELPATKLTYRCYQAMFRGCTSLINAPKLPAVTIDVNDSPYYMMFFGCSRLSKLYCNTMNYKNGTVITTAIGSNWLQGVATTGTFYKNPKWDGPTTRGVNTVPAEWTIVDWTDAYNLVFENNNKYYALNTNGTTQRLDGCTLTDINYTDSNNTFTLYTKHDSLANTDFYALYNWNGTKHYQQVNTGDFNGAGNRIHIASVSDSDGNGTYMSVEFDSNGVVSNWNDWVVYVDDNHPTDTLNGYELIKDIGDVTGFTKYTFDRVLLLKTSELEDLLK